MPHIYHNAVYPI